MGSSHRVLATLGLPRSRVCASPIYTAQASSCSTWSEPCVACGSSFGYYPKVQIRLGLHFVPSLAGVAQAARSLTGALSPGAVCLLPSAVPASVSMHTSQVPATYVCFWELASSQDPPGGCRPSRISGSLWLETGGLLQFGRGCHLWGQVCPFPHPPASCLQRGWASPPPASSSLELLSTFVLRMAGRLIFSLSLVSHSLSCYLMLAPSDCPQVMQPGPYPKQRRLLLSVPPPLAGGGCGHLGYFSAGSGF